VTPHGMPYISPLLASAAVLVASIVLLTQAMLRDRHSLCVRRATSGRALKLGGEVGR
jgi:hypothetical protein